MSERQKRCPRCRETWPLTPEFYRRIRARGRIRWQSYCRACEAEWIADKRKHWHAFGSCGTKSPPCPRCKGKVS